MSSQQNPKIKFGKRLMTPNHNIDFSWLINHTGSLLTNVERTLCHDIRIMRNCYIHYENIIAHLAKKEEVDLPSIEIKLRDKFGNQIVDALIAYLEQTIGDQNKFPGMIPIRFQHLEKKEAIQFIEKRSKQYIDWLPGAWSARQTIISAKEFDNFYGIEAYDALDCLMWTFRVLKSLKIIS